MRYFCAIILLALTINNVISDGRQNIILGNIVGTVESDSGTGRVNQNDGYNSDQDKYNNENNGGSGTVDLLFSGGNENTALQANKGTVGVNQIGNGNGNANTITNIYSLRGNSKIIYKVAVIGANVTNGSGVNQVDQNRNFNNGTNVFMNE